MSDRIKKIKIKQADGTFSDYIPIGANAKDIDLQYNDSNVENTLKKKPYYYDNVEAMKLDDALREGDMAITLGYYEANDGGGGLYQIIDDSSLVDDGGSIHTLNNGLRAKLIHNNGINVKQFGAYGDGEHDDTLVIQNAIDYLYNEMKKIGDLGIINSACDEYNTVYIPNGQYKITSTINLSRFVKLHTLDGYVYLQSYVSNGATIHIYGTSQTDYNSWLSVPNQSYFKGPIINGESGFIMQYMNTDKGNSIAIELGTSTDLSSSRSLANYSLSDFHIYNFHIGLLYNHFHNHNGTIHRGTLSGNDINIQFGSGESGATDSGERLSFIDCLIANAKNDIGANVLFASGGWETHWISCSFDYSNVCFYRPLTSNNLATANIFCTNCHFEGLGIQNLEDETTPHGISWNIAGTIMIKNSMLYRIYKNIAFYITEENKCHLFINGLYITGNSFIDGEHCELISKEILIHEYKVTYNENAAGYIPSLSLNLFKKNMFGDTVGVKDITASDYKLEDWTFAKGNWINAPLDQLEIVEDNPFGEYSLKIPMAEDSSDKGYTRLQMTSDFIPVESNKYFSTVVVMKNPQSNQGNCICTYYDSNQKFISQTNTGGWNINAIDDQWYISRRLIQNIVPRGCRYIKVSVDLRFAAEKDGYIGLIYCGEY